MRVTAKPLQAGLGNQMEDGVSATLAGVPVEAEIATQAPATVRLAVAALTANDYNPNGMTEAQFAELAAEVRHLGRLPKPLIVRPNGTGYVIIDGEHGWRAAVTVGLTEVPCEVVDVDDFEARRQTFKRNQHGTHQPVRLGTMFRQMMAARSLSQRALAREIEVSEGTIRNALQYAEAADSLRNSYAADNRAIDTDTVEETIAALSVRQVRCYLELPEGLRHRWLEGGADIKHASGWQYIHHLLYEYWPKYREFQTTFRQMKQWSSWQRHWCIGGLKWEDLLPYTRHYFKGAWVVRDAGLMDAALEYILAESNGVARFLLTPEEFETTLSNGGVHGDSHSAFCERLQAAVMLKGCALPPGRNWRIRQQVQEHEIAASAPDYIQQSALPAKEKYAVWKTPTPESMSDAAAERIRRKLASSSRLYADNDEDAQRIVRRAFHSAQACARIKDVYRKLTERQLAEKVAKWFPLYDPTDTVEALLISALTDKLEKTFSRAELICLTQMAEGWEWDQTMATMLKAISGLKGV